MSVTRAELQRIKNRVQELEVEIGRLIDYFGSSGKPTRDNTPELKTASTAYASKKNRQGGKKR